MLNRQRAGRLNRQRAGRLRRSSALCAFPLACALMAGCAGSSGAAGASGHAGHRSGRPQGQDQAQRARATPQRSYRGTGHLKTVSVRLGGHRRTYLLYVPPGDAASHPLPLVLVFHGAGDTAGHTVDETDLPNIARQSHNMVLVFPQGYDDTWNEGTGRTPAAQARIDDVAFVATILRRVEGNYAIDMHRVVATGFSNGALLTEYLGCTLSRQLTMIAPVEGQLPDVISSRCHPAAPLTVLEVHGTADGAIPYAGGGFTGINGPGPRVLSAPHSAQRWAALDRCPQPPRSTTAGAVTFSTYSGCADGTAVTLATIDGGHHAWPKGWGPTLSKAIAALAVTRDATR